MLTPLGDFNGDGFAHVGFVGVGPTRRDLSAFHFLLGGAERRSGMIDVNALGNSLTQPRGFSEWKGTFNLEAPGDAANGDANADGVQDLLVVRTPGEDDPVEAWLIFGGADL